MNKLVFLYVKFQVSGQTDQVRPDLSDLENSFRLHYPLHKL